MEINDALWSRQLERSEGMTQYAYGRSSAGDNSGFVVRFWGMDKKGQQINTLITFSTEMAARCAAAWLLGELGARVHFWTRP